MDDLHDRVKNLPPEKRAILMRQLLARRGAAASAETPPKPARAVRCDSGENFQAFLSRPGDLESLVFRSIPRVPPSAGTIQLQVRTVSLNFRDLMIALGIYPSTPDGLTQMGSDCAGTIVAVGEQIDTYPIGDEEFFIPEARELKVGDEVIALTGKYRCPNSDFSPYINVSPFEVVHRPASLAAADAACIPTAFVTAYYSLYTQAQLAPGERVLIHSAAGGVGLAAIQVARWRGAEILATAGTNEKRDYLRSIGVEHVMDSESLDFADEVLRVTGGKGVDVILNSLPGAAIERGLALLRPFGRFVEIGKRDIYQNTAIGLRPFSKGISLISMDLGMFHKCPPVLSRVYPEVVERVVSGELGRLPHQVFPVASAGQALAEMSRGTHIGKLVLAYEGQVDVVDPASSVAP